MQNGRPGHRQEKTPGKETNVQPHINSKVRAWDQNLLTKGQTGREVVALKKRGNEPARNKVCKMQHMIPNMFRVHQELTGRKGTEGALDHRKDEEKREHIKLSS